MCSDETTPAVVPCAIPDGRARARRQAPQRRRQADGIIGNHGA